MTHDPFWTPEIAEAERRAAEAQRQSDILGMLRLINDRLDVHREQLQLLRKSIDKIVEFLRPPNKREKS